MSNPFSHDTLSNTQPDYSFNTDEGVPDWHVTAFGQAMDAPASNLGEQDYRYPGGRPGSDQPAADGTRAADPVQPWQAPAQPQAGYYPRGYAP